MRKKIRLRQMVLFLSGVVLLVLSAVQYAYIAKTEHVVRARFEGGIVRAAQVDDYYEQHGKAVQGSKKQDGDIPYVTLWDMKEGIAVAAEGYVRQESFSLIEGYGNLEQILPGQRLEGMYPSKSDTEDAPSVTQARRCCSAAAMSWGKSCMWTAGNISSGES